MMDKVTVTVSEKDKPFLEDWTVDELIEFLHEAKIKGATHISISDYDSDQEIYSYYKRDMTDEEIQKQSERSTLIITPKMDEIIEAMKTLGHPHLPICDFLFDIKRIDKVNGDDPKNVELKYTPRQ